MNVFHIAKYRLIRNLKDYKHLMLLLIAPLLIIFFTGSSTDEVYSKNIKINISYYNLDNGDIGRAFDEFLNSEDAVKAFNVIHVKFYDEGIESVKTGKCENFIFIDKNFSSDFYNGSKINIKVLGNRDITFAKIMVEGFKNHLNSFNAVTKIGGTPVQKEFRGIDETEFTRTKNTPTGMDRWTYLNMLLILFYGAFLGSFSVINNKRKNTIARLNTAPIGRFTNVLGEFIGNTATLFITVLIIIPFTTLFYGSNWNGNIGLILPAFLMFSCMITALGMILAYITWKPALSVAVIVTLNVFLANGAVGIDLGVTNSFITWISRISPHYYVYTVIMDSIFGGPGGRIGTSMISLAAGTLTFMAAALILGRRRAE
jgi:ABC-2 type transport system permease protein